MDQTLVSKIKTANSTLLTEGRLEAVGEFFTPDYIAHGTDNEIRGHVEIRRSLGMLRHAFPEVQVAVEVLVAGETRLAWQRTLWGTQQGAFKGFPATGREVRWREMVISQFRDSLISEEWVVTDLAERLLLSRKR
jgi:predicted ester cyclase